MLRERVGRCPFVAASGQPSPQDGADEAKGQKLVDSTLQEIRKRHSSSHRLSSQEIDHLLGDIRRSRSASCEAGGSTNRRSCSEGRGHIRPPPPLHSPPALPDELLPFGRNNSKVNIAVIFTIFRLKPSFENYCYICLTYLTA
jgi:hypothetical protein